MDDGRYIMLFVTCGASGIKCVVEDQGLYVASSLDGVTFALENQGLPILANPPGVCDFIAPRPVLQKNGFWYVYVQGTENCTLEQAKANAAIYLATGTSLTRGALSWVTEPGNPARARRVLHTNPRPGCPDSYDPNAKDECVGSGIGEDHQWFNVTLDDYLGAFPDSIMALYNNWNYLPSINGLSAALTSADDGTSMSYWYGPMTTPWSADAGSLFPDVMLGGTEGMADYGSPAIKFAESCVEGATRFRPLTYAGYWPDPYPFNGQTGKYRRSRRPKGPLPAAIETVTGSGAVTTGGSGFRPRLARNPYGFLDPDPGSEPKRWRTFLYYTVSPINNNDAETCNGYTASKTTLQTLGVSEMVITELPR